MRCSGSPTKLILEILSDREWHMLDELMVELRDVWPPETLMRYAVGAYGQRMLKRERHVAMYYGKRHAIVNLLHTLTRRPQYDIEKRRVSTRRRSKILAIRLVELST